MSGRRGRERERVRIGEVGEERVERDKKEKRRRSRKSDWNGNR